MLEKSCSHVIVWGKLAAFINIKTKNNDNNNMIYTIRQIIE